jgi:hypothetical protein
MHLTRVYHRPGNASMQQDRLFINVRGVAAGFQQGLQALGFAIVIDQRQRAAIEIQHPFDFADQLRQQGLKISRLGHQQNDFGE